MWETQIIKKANKEISNIVCRSDKRFEEQQNEDNMVHTPLFICLFAPQNFIDVPGTVPGTKEPVETHL